MPEGDKTAPESFVLGDDLPKENPWRDDRLGYKPFCERLSKVIQSLRVQNGYVVGLHGDWGSGKSSQELNQDERNLIAAVAKGIGETLHTMRRKRQ